MVEVVRDDKKRVRRDACQKLFFTVSLVICIYSVRTECTGTEKIYAMIMIFLTLYLSAILYFILFYIFYISEIRFYCGRSARYV